MNVMLSSVSETFRIAHFGISAFSFSQMMRFAWSRVGAQ